MAIKVRAWSVFNLNWNMFLWWYYGVYQIFSILYWNDAAECQHVAAEGPACRCLWSNRFYTSLLKSEGLEKRQRSSNKSQSPNATLQYENGGETRVCIAKKFATVISVPRHADWALKKCWPYMASPLFCASWQQTKWDNGNVKNMTGLWENLKAVAGIPTTSVN